MQSAHLEALNARRQALIDSEIARLLREKMANEDAMMLLMMAAIA